MLGVEIGYMQGREGYQCIPGQVSLKDHAGVNRGQRYQVLENPTLL